MTADAREPMKLLPCPFCGGSDQKIMPENCVCGGKKKPLYVFCCGCMAMGPMSATPEEEWNRRTPGANVQALVKAARAYAKHETVYYRWKLEEVLAAFPEEQ